MHLGARGGHHSFSMRRTRVPVPPCGRRGSPINVLSRCLRPSATRGKVRSPPASIVGTGASTGRSTGRIAAMRPSAIPRYPL